MEVIANMETINSIDLTGDTLKNILIMAPMLDEAGQNKVFGLICGLISSVKTEPVKIVNS